MALIRGLKIEQPPQFVNFRDLTRLAALLGRPIRRPPSR